MDDTLICAQITCQLYLIYTLFTLKVKLAL